MMRMFVGFHDISYSHRHVHVRHKFNPVEFCHDNKVFFLAPVISRRSITKHPMNSHHVCPWGSWMAIWTNFISQCMDQRWTDPAFFQPGGQSYESYLLIVTWWYWRFWYTLLLVVFGVLFLVLIMLLMLFVSVIFMMGMGQSVRCVTTHSSYSLFFWTSETIHFLDIFGVHNDLTHSDITFLVDSICMEACHI